MSSASQTLAAFTVTGFVFTGLLTTAAVVVPKASDRFLNPVRMAGPTVKRWSGYLLVAVGIWFVSLAAIPSPLWRLS